jgi:hypothetical protein
VTKNPFTTVPELAATLNCSPQAILCKLKARKMSPLQVGGSFLLTDADVARVRQPMAKGVAKGTKRGKRKPKETSGDIRADESTTETTKEQN